MEIKFTKMQGCGNDFVIVGYDEYLKTELEMSKLAVKLCDRHFGIGADGLIIPNINPADTDIGWFFYNSDGSTAQMCGNGMRCFAKYVYDNKLINKKEFTVKTLAGIIKPVILDNGLVKVNMSKPILEPTKIPFLPSKNLNYKIAIQGNIFEGNAISMGNPHFVIFIENENLLELAKKYGPEIEKATEFPEKTNVEFIKVNSKHDIDLRVWERGCGITLACGTGACASVVAGILNNYLDAPVDVKLLGGKVSVDWAGSNNNSNEDVYLIGPAEYVFAGSVKI
jgi:diaminopimelate epimerase